MGGSREINRARKPPYPPYIRSEGKEAADKTAEDEADGSQRAEDGEHDLSGSR